MQLFSNDLGVDLGTSNVLIYVENKGVVIREPSVVAVDRNSGKILQVGTAAKNMLGRTPGNVVAMHPLRDGVISDHEMTVKMLQILFRSAGQTNFFTPKPRVIISVPSGVTEVEERTVINAAIEAGARRVYLIEEPLAAALGAGLDIKGPNGHMVVDIGGGTTDVAVLSLGGVVVSESIKVAGDKFDEAIIKHVRRKHNILIGEKTAEMLKVQIGCAYPRDEELTLDVRGRNLITGLPATVTVSSTEMLEALEEPVSAIFEAVHVVLEKTPPELMADISQRGIVMTGGGALLYGLDRMLATKIGIDVYIAQDAISCVAIGTGKALDMMDKFAALGDR